MPAYCILNNLFTDDVPEVISSLNTFEKILIQRAKAFQTVLKMGTVINKKLPQRQMVQKETLNKLCSITDPINDNHELYILIRGIPTKSKIIWGEIVNIKKVFDALTWLKRNNTLYSHIILSNDHNDLCLTKLEKATLDNEPKLLNDSIEEIKNDVEVILESQYKKTNKTATTLYQMLKIHDLSLDNREQYLDLMCFLNLYPFGINGQHEFRQIKLFDHEFIKCRLTSKHLQYRLNQQYLFYLLNDANIRQLSLCYTAAEYLEAVSKELLESNLNTIFAILRNTEQYWRKPRSDLNCMTQHHWLDLGEYIREVNGWHDTSLCVSVLVARDPISTVRFLDNKFRAMLDFISCKHHPIGEVTHYFWRQKYQGRGIQHFHLLIWIKNAPIFGESTIEENNYNAVLLTAWEGNMNIQFIGEKSSLLTWYTTKYMNKAGKSEFIPLYGTDQNTTIKWLDVNQVRYRKLKNCKEIETLNVESTDIFYPSLIDNHYLHRPNELENMSLNEFRGYFINHYKYDVNTQPENYFFSLLLMFQPWRKLEDFINECDTYAELFHKVKLHLVEALQYHERLKKLQKAFETAKELIQQCLDDDLQKQQLPDDPENPIGVQYIQAGEAMQDFKDFGKIIREIDVSKGIAKLNTDQKRVFDRVINTVNSDDKSILRLYVKVEKVEKVFKLRLKCWIKQNLNKNTAVAASTGIAAFNIDGLTIHRLLQLPVEYFYEHKDVILFVIDEMSMISNLILMYMHLRLSEIFDTNDCNDGWFGQKHILLFGDLLQLPPVHENSIFMHLFDEKIAKHLGSLNAISLWTILFDYDELTINMRQQGDDSYRELLSRICIGLLTKSDNKILENRKIFFKEDSFESRLKKLCNFINNLPSDTVCLLPTCMCDVLNDATLNRIVSKKILLIAEDTIECIPYVKKNIKNIIKLLLSSGLEYLIKRVSVKFEVIDRAYVIRKKFPLSLSYGITIHKSQGLSLQSAVMDIGNSVFNHDKVYVAFEEAIEYNRLKGIHKPKAERIFILKVRYRKVKDVLLALPKIITYVQKSDEKVRQSTTWVIHGFQNTDKVSYYANAVLQCLLHLNVIRQQLFNCDISDDDKLIKAQKFNLCSVPTTKVLLAGQFYKTMNAILYHCSCIDEGHYISICKEGTSNIWTEADDAQIEKKQWPKSAKNLYKRIFIKNRFL
ncbi:hypothetical protein ACFW04_012241 [Cataglyphis niger]